MQVANNILKNIAPLLIHGDIKRIAEKTGIEQSVVSNHIRGRTKFVKMQIIDAAIKVIEERKRQECEIEKRIHDILV